MSRTSHAKHEHKNKKKHQDISYEKPHEDYHAGVMGDIVIGLLILGLGIFFIVPFYSLMSTAGQIAAITLFLLAIAIFILFVWKKRKRNKIK